MTTCLKILCVSMQWMLVIVQREIQRATPTIRQCIRIESKQLYMAPCMHRSIESEC